MNNCSHINTIRVEAQEEVYIECSNCNIQWSESEWTDMKENEEIIADEMLMSVLGK